MEAVYFTCTGKVRSNNEDSLLVKTCVVSEESFESCKRESLDGEYVLLAVADGMGGHAKGEVASKLVLKTLSELGPLESEEDIKQALQSARRRLEDYAKTNPSAFGLGCAVAGLVIKGNEGIAFNVGDCRVYRFVNGRLVRLTRDHSVVEELVLDGVITPQEARTHPQRNILTSAIIGDGYSTELKIFTVKVDMDAGGRFLICSDGLWDEFEESEIEVCLSAEKPCEEFLKVFDTKPLRDNLSFIILL